MTGKEVRRYTSVSLSKEVMEALENLRKWYGHRSRAEAVRFLAEKALKEIKVLEDKEIRSGRRGSGNLSSESSRW